MTKRIVVVGAGFAGMWSALSAARALAQVGKIGTEVEISLIAPSPELHVRPRFYEPDVAQMKAPLRDVFDSVGVRYIPGSVERIDVTAHTVEVLSADGSRSTVSFDRLVLASGSRLYRPDIPGLLQHSFSCDQIDEAAALEEHIKKLSQLPGSAARNTVVIVGGGFTGIEIAAEMPSRLRDALGSDAQTRVILVEQADQIGPDLGPGPRPVILEALTKLGVTLKLGSAVQQIGPTGVVIATGERLEANTVVWTGGLRASSLTAQIPGKRDRLGRLHVERDLRVAGSDRVFAAGDVAYAATDRAGNHAMMSCQHAMNLGRVSGHNVAQHLLGLPTIEYSQPKYVTCLDLGSWGAVYTEGWERQVKMSGTQAKALKKQINSQWIYPPNAIRDEVLKSADPLRVVVA